MFKFKTLCYLVDLPKFQKVKTKLFCVGRRHFSAARSTVGNITCKSTILLKFLCSICDRKTSTTVRDNTLAAEGLGDCFEIFDQKGLNVSKKITKLV